MRGFCCFLLPPLPPPTISSPKPHAKLSPRSAYAHLSSRASLPARAEAEHRQGKTWTSLVRGLRVNSLLWVHGRREWVTPWGPNTNSTAWAATPGQRPAYWGGGLPELTFNPHSQGSWPRRGLVSWEAPPSHPGRVSCSALLRAQGPLCLQSPLPPLLLRPCPSLHVLSKATSSGPLQTTLISADPFLISLPPCIPESHGVPAGPHHWCANPAHALAERDQWDQAWAVPDRSRSWAPSLTWAGPAQLLTCSSVSPMCSGSSGFWWVSSLSPCQHIPLGTVGLWAKIPCWSPGPLS